MTKVALLRCSGYQEELLRAQIEQALELIDYRLPDLSGKTVLLKPNILAAAPPESAVCTHPLVVKVLIRLFQENGAKVWVGDSPAIETLTRAAKHAGVLEVVDATGAELVDFSEVVEVDVPAGRIVKKLPLAKPVVEADYVVSVAKLKTHGLTRYTGAVKNLFGCIPGKRKAQFHLRMSEIHDFAGLLVDIHSAVAPNLVVVDGIVGMEGAGPRNGRPRRAESLIVSTDGHSADLDAGRLIGLSPAQIPTLRSAIRSGILNPEEVLVVGETPESFGLVGRFELPPDTRGLSVYLPGFILRRLTNLLTAKPVPVPERCIGCGICAQSCPPQVISIVNQKVNFDYTDCIRCYCCQELCPHGAISIKTSWLSRLFESR